MFITSASDGILFQPDIIVTLVLIGLLAVEVLPIVAGFATRNSNERKLHELRTQSTLSETQLQQNELERMDKAMNTTFRYAFIAFVVLMVAAMLWIALTQNAYWRGMGIALMILVGLLTTGGSFNAFRNARYLDTVRAYTPDTR